MAKKEARISINALERIAKENFQNTITKEWFGIEVNIRRTLPLEDVLMFTEDIVNACFTSDGTFIPQVMDFAIKDGILTRYANFTMPSDTKKQYELVYATDAVEMVMEEIDQEQLESIVDAADRKIDYLCDTNIKEVSAKLEAILKTFEEMGTTVEQMFGGMTPEDMQKMLGAISEAGKLDEEKIVSAYMSQRGMDAATEESDAADGAGEE